MQDELRKTNSQGRIRTAFRWALRLGGLALILSVLGLLFWLRGALYNRFVRFPREAAEWAAIRADRQPVAETIGWNEYHGIVHSHSEHSHDCEVPFEEILRVLQKTGRDFICLSDHCTDSRADFNLQWRGLRDGKLFIPGFEMKDGLMPFGVAPDVVLSNNVDGDLLAKQIVENGGVLFYAHPEEPRVWSRPELTGLEIYNIHADFKDEGSPLLRLLPDILVNQRRFPDHVFRLIFDRPAGNLQRWDECNRTRHLTGIAGNDCHQNTGVRIHCTESRDLRIEDTSPETLVELKLNRFTRLLARLCFGPLEPGRKLFHAQLDPYERMTRFVATHMLARELSEPAIIDSLRAGRAFVGFDMLADSTGFVWLAENPEGRAIMGEALSFSTNTQLRAAAPHLCRLTVLRDGSPVHQQTGRSLEWTPPSPGRYRVEAELQIRNEWVPWIYANPIWLH